MKRKDCNTQSPSPAERLPPLGRIEAGLTIWSLNIDSIHDRWTLILYMIAEHWFYIWSLNIDSIYDRWTLILYMITEHWFYYDHWFYIWSLNIDSIYDRWTLILYMITEYWFYIWSLNIDSIYDHWILILLWSLNIDSIYDHWTLILYMITEHWFYTWSLNTDLMLSTVHYSIYIFDHKILTTPLSHSWCHFTSFSSPLILNVTCFYSFTLFPSEPKPWMQSKHWTLHVKRSITRSKLMNWLLKQKSRKINKLSRRHR